MSRASQGLPLPPSLLPFFVPVARKKISTEKGYIPELFGDKLTLMLTTRLKPLPVRGCPYLCDLHLPLSWCGIVLGGPLFQVIIVDSQVLVDVVM